MYTEPIDAVVSEFPLPEHSYQLIQEISESELKQSIKSHRGGSSPGIDGIPSTMYKKLIGPLLPVLLTLYNAVLVSCSWPTAWNMSVIMPLFKKGDRMKHGNYRPISLVPTISKFLEKVLDGRLGLWLEKENIVSETQGGCRKDYSTTDRVFILQALIGKYCRGNGRLFVAFLDFEKAFDSIDRPILFRYLVKIGLPRPFIMLLINMYEITLSVVFIVKKGVSRPFRTFRGVRQGCTLSPKLFSLYINDFAEFLEMRWAPVVSLANTLFSFLLFVDDTALVAKSAEELQTLLNLTESYLESKKLKLNASKTEIVIFQSRKPNGPQDYSFTYKDEAIKVTPKYKYLGFVVAANGNWTEHIKLMISRGKAAACALLRQKHIMGIKNMKMHKYLFMTKVLPVAHYGCELWETTTVKQLESLQFMYFKRVIGLQNNFSSLVLKGDLGLQDLRHMRTIQMIKFWLQVTRLPDNRLAKAAYTEMLSFTKKAAWPKQVKALLDNAGLSWAWNEGQGPLGKPEDFLGKFASRLRDQEIQVWLTGLEKSSSLHFYRQIKDVYGEEFYLKLNLPWRTLKYWLQARANCIPLRKGYWESYDEDGSGSRRACPLCGEFGDGMDHFLSRCQSLANFRDKFFHGDVPLLPGVLGTTSRDLIIALGCFIENSLMARKEAVV